MYIYIYISYHTFHVDDVDLCFFVVMLDPGPLDLSLYEASDLRGSQPRFCQSCSQVSVFVKPIAPRLKTTQLKTTQILSLDWFHFLFQAPPLNHTSTCKTSTVRVPIIHLEHYHLPLATNCDRLGPSSQWSLPACRYRWLSQETWDTLQGYSLYSWNRSRLDSGWMSSFEEWCQIHVSRHTWRPTWCGLQRFAASLLNALYADWEASAYAQAPLTIP